MWRAMLGAWLSLMLLLPISAHAQPEMIRGSYIARDFTFANGQSLSEIRLAYTTLGTPHRDASGRIDNAVLLIHGTGGSGEQFLSPTFQQALFGPGKPLDTSHYYLVLADAIGHGGSSRPSDGLRMAFPAYDYADIVQGQYRLLTEHLGIDHLRAILGYSMGGMVTFQWAVDRPGFADGYIPLGCYPVEVAGQNRMLRKLQLDAIRGDPAWKNGRYRTQPITGIRMAMGLVLLSGGSAHDRQAQAPTRAAADQLLEDSTYAMAMGRDANDLLYQIDASRTYNPWDRLARINAPLLWINAADDQVNPVSLDIAPAALARMPTASFLLIPASDETRGHGTLLLAHLWADRLGAFLAGLPKQGTD